MKVWNENMESAELDLTSLTADIVSAYVAHNALTGDKLPGLIGLVYDALSRASLQAVEPEKVELKPAVAIKKSEYREKWGLPRDYPMVAPSYAAARSDLAKNMGLGRRGTAVAGIQPKTPAAAELAEKPKGRGKQTRKASTRSQK